MKKEEDELVLAKASEFVAQFEGFVDKPYRCPAGLLTFGYGSLVRNYPNVKYPVSQATALIYLAKDLKYAYNAVKIYISASLDIEQRVALTSFTHNVGSGNLRNSTLRRVLNNGDYEAAAEEFLRWNKAGGKVLKGLKKRRAAERELFLTNVKLKDPQDKAKEN